MEGSEFLFPFTRVIEKKKVNKRPAKIAAKRLSESLPILPMDLRTVRSKQYRIHTRAAPGWQIFKHAS